MTLSAAQYQYDNQTPFDKSMDNNEFAKLVDEEVYNIKERVKQGDEQMISDLESEIIPKLDVIIQCFAELPTWEFDSMINAKLEDAFRDYAEYFVKQSQG